MRFKAAIFDMDGTLLESMHIWQNLAPDFLKRHNIFPEKDFAIQTSVPSIRGAVRYMIEKFDMDVDEDHEVEKIYTELRTFYNRQVTVKPGVPELLEALHSAGIVSGVVTATESDLAAAALEYTGLKKYFHDRILSGAELNLSKSTPKPFQMMCDILGSAPEETIVFEDALYAAKCAADAGYHVAAVYDSSEPQQVELQQLAVWYCRHWNEFPLHIFQNLP